MAPCVAWADVCVFVCISIGPESSPRSVWMSKADFDASIRELVPARWIPEADKQRLSQVCVRERREGREKGGQRERQRERELSRG